VATVRKGGKGKEREKEKGELCKCKGRLYDAVERDSIAREIAGDTYRGCTVPALVAVVVVAAVAAAAAAAAAVTAAAAASVALRGGSDRTRRGRTLLVAESALRMRYVFT